ncbi:hypothetical protein Q2T70_03790 [Klebsiella oxytoca]|uniref:hypothetical protein n=1 Tax=Klebsiella oxytoca TaxID=571 RepID=UPI00265E418E|nr:hypothetical protein [Klebsiella oxytoca]WKM72880.1 hypothetical protein Q2T70_03790 [Klebsiella oxytoca]
MRNLKGRLKRRDKDSSVTVGLSSKDDACDVDSNPPIFSLRYVQKDFCIDCCEKHEKAALADSLFRLSKISWSEIRKAGRHGLGTEKISRSAIKAPIPSHVTEDVEFIAFRFCSKAPMVGYKLGAVFYVLWLDRAFKLYKH